MPRYATVFAEIICPACGQVVDDRVDVQWGRLSASYDLGDRVGWRRDAQGRIIEPFILYPGEDYAWNCGDPDIHNVLLLDVKCYRRENKPHCPHCKTRFDGILVTVENDHFTSVRPLMEGELDSLVGKDAAQACDIFVLADDGTIVPRFDWVDKPLRYMESQAEHHDSQGSAGQFPLGN